jgi:hypothetical protein
MIKKIIKGEEWRKRQEQREYIMNIVIIREKFKLPFSLI